MGYTKLHYDDYQENIDYWYGEQGIILPKWADEISAIGESTSALDFYDDIFGDDLEEHKDNPYEYQKGEYAAIALELEYTKDDEGKEVTIARRTTITRGQPELYDLIEYSDKFCVVAPVSYAGRSRHNENARFLYALCVEIDNIQVDGGIDELIHSWNRQNSKMPKPTYIVCSGNGLHLYIVFERPIPLFKNIFEKLTDIKTYLTEWWWSKPISSSYNKIQYESICQGFRCVGTVGKDTRKIAMAFKTGEKWTIEKLNECLPDDLQLNEIYKSKMTKEQAQKLYPEWYQRRIVEGKARKVFTRHPGIYYNWKNKILNGAAVGKRYYCLENLCSLAVQCCIPPEEVEKDCHELAKYLDTLTISEKNHFTKYDILCALRTFYRANEGAYRRRRDYVAKRTGIELPENKRNHRKQKIHLKIARSTLEIMNEEQGKILQGRPVGSGTAQDQVLDWQANNPDGSKSDCKKETGLSYPTIRKWWNTERKVVMEQKDKKKHNQYDYMLTMPDGSEVVIESKDMATAKEEYNKRLQAYYDSLKKNKN